MERTGIERYFARKRAQSEPDRHGKNKQKRNDCRQVAIGMAFDERGLPLSHEVFEGNIADSKTLERMLDRLVLSADSGYKPVVILDAGFASSANITLLKERGLDVVRDEDKHSQAEEFCGDYVLKTDQTLGSRKPA